MTKQYISLKGFEKLTNDIRELKKQAADYTLLMKANRENESGDEGDNTEMLRLMQEREGISEKFSELERYCLSCNVIDMSTLPDEETTVRFATTVTLFDIQINKSFTYTLLGERESSPRDSTISYLSPIGAAIMGEKVGNVITLDTPSGERELEITNVIRNKF